MYLKKLDELQDTIKAFKESRKAVMTEEIKKESKKAVITEEVKKESDKSK